MTFVDTSPEVIKQMRNAARRGCRKIAKEIVQQTIETAPNNRGYIRKSLKYGAYISSHTGQASGTVGYLKKSKLKEKGIKFVLNPSWLEFGTKSHSIKSGSFSKNGISKKALANRTSNIVFGKSIVHPGSKPIPMLKEAGKRVSPNAQSIAESELKVLSEINDRLNSIPDDGNDEI